MKQPPSNAMNHYATAGALVGCPPDQIRNFLTAGIVLQQRQLMASALARECDQEDGPLAVGYGGARGGGKSHWLLAQMGADDCQRVAGLKCLLLRKVGKANIENLEDLRQRLFSRLPHELQVQRGILRFQNGSRIHAGHFQSEKDIDAYLGLEYDVIGIEEATTLTSRKYEDILTCARTSRVLPDGRVWRPRVYSTTNPGGVGHAWYKAEFIDPFKECVLDGPTRFVPARVTDNPFINREYAQNLQTLTGWQRKAWFEGSWEFAAGQFFSNFDPKVHVLDAKAPDPVGGMWIGGFDYGFADWNVFLLAHRSAEGGIMVWDEVAMRQSVPQLIAEAIHACCRRHGLRAGRAAIHANPELFLRSAESITVRDEYRRHGISLRPASADRVSGWAEILKGLGDPRQKIAPTLFIHPRCEHLLDRLPALQVNPNQAQDALKVNCDEDGEGGDDSLDALRYLVGTRLGGQLTLLRL